MKARSLKSNNRSSTAGSGAIDRPKSSGPGRQPLASQKHKATTKSGRQRQVAATPAIQDLGFRVFLTYFHQDAPLLRRIVEVLKHNDLEPMWDENLLIGRGFDEQIKNYIAHAHVFVPLLTPAADSRKWVHQEIGYAMALNVPVLPVVMGDLPADREMIHSLHALCVPLGKNGAPVDLSPVRTHLTKATVRKLVEAHSDARLAIYACADFHEQRAAMLASYCRNVQALGRFGLVRQKGGLSSFHIPTETIKHPIWRQRYGRYERSLEHCLLLKREREALFEHARQAGCRLIVSPKLPFRAYGRLARLVRLRTLHGFLVGMSDEQCQVALWKPEQDKENVTIVGDWFSAKSVYSQLRYGYFQTNFTRHAPSVLEAIAEFDEEFYERLRDDRVKPRDSRRRAISVIAHELAVLQREMKAKGEL